ncbi:MAG: tRNA (guanine-N(1)-)-methyltransferase [uncultured bacterium]|nr:MAG: tRNA (guanine-N(1)-)-methyltransferase [uncultured bacterium]HBD05176.1 tRNA (guanosine(37)-N1)-methyltransferase TrmD [Candidatus Uhrbacteria bacterium]
MNKKRQKLRIDIVTIFPAMCEAYLNESILGRAQKTGLLDLRAHDLRKYSADKKHKKVDDSPYGGGPGMVMMIEPFDIAVRDLISRKAKNKTRVILTSASGKRFTQNDAKRLAKYDQIIFLCGRYEGVDHRVQTELCDEALSIGDFVLTGGELPALAMSDAISRMIPGVLGKSESLLTESHTKEGYLEYPQYTKPAVYKTISKKTLRVPRVLLSGDHKAIELWRMKAGKNTGKK